MRNIRAINVLLCCVGLLARLIFLGILFLIPAGPGFADGLFGNEGNSETAVACPDGNLRVTEKGAVGLIAFRDPDTMGNPIVESCTGTLLNDTAHDFRYFFLTARHCLKCQPDGDLQKWLNLAVVYWNFQEPATTSTTSTARCPTIGTDFCAQGHAGTNGCDLGVPMAISSNQLTVGATLISNSVGPTPPNCIGNVYGTDFMLLELKDNASHVLQLCPTGLSPPLCVHYAGWDARNGPGSSPPAAPVAGIHHPMGDAKAISTSKNSPPSYSIYWDVPWLTGTTERGSSGSCLFDANDRCVGHASLDPRPGTTLFVKFQAIYSQIAAWIDTATRYYNDGDPHITTVDGTHYNFQGAGEYVSLRNPSGLEIQTRQAPIATTFNPGADPHDGVATCVSVNTAVAARVGTHTVSYEPSFVGGHGLELRLDHQDPITLHQLSQLFPNGRNLDGGGRIAKTVAPSGDESLEIEFPDASVLFVTPGGPFEGKWYLNVDFLRHLAMDGTAGAGTGDAARAAVGLMGAVPQGSWLPALPDGTPVPMPRSYAGLYQTFGDAWRVTDKNSLFHYAPGTSTGTFTLPSCASTDSGRSSEKCWPPEIPPNWPSQIPRCLIPGTTPAEPASRPVAQEACRQIIGKNMLADCTFDVMATGNTGFAQTYLATQQFQPGATETTVKGDKDATKYGRSVTFTATVVSAASSSQAVTAGTVQFKLDGSEVGNPVALKPNGQAVWITSGPPPVDLPVGIHQVAASFIPPPPPSPYNVYLASVSPYESHTVIETFDWYLWLAILLLIVVLIFLAWWNLRRI